MPKSHFMTAQALRSRYGSRNVCGMFYMKVCIGIVVILFAHSISPEITFKIQYNNNNKQKIDEICVFSDF